MADAMESAGDVFGSVLILIGLRYAAQPADENHPYGHGKAEALFTFVVVVLLIGGAAAIAYRSILNILTPHPMPAKFTLITLAVTIVLKEIFFRIVTKKGKESNSQLLQGDAWHHRSDAITSLAALVGISVALWLGKGYEAADDWAALPACAIIIYTAWRLFRPALGEVMDEHVHDELIASIRMHAAAVSGVRGTEKCMVRKSGSTYFVDLHINVDPEISVREGHEVAHGVEDAIREFNPNVRMIIHVEPHEPEYTQNES
jgi:cation diffusion facilitator family transporter